MSRELKYELVRNQPVARFYYKGDHTKPVRRTVVLVKDGVKSDTITGYEIRVGSNTRPLHKAPVKSFSRSKIAVISQCGMRLRNRTPKKLHSKSTFERKGLVDLVLNGE